MHSVWLPDGEPYGRNRLWPHALPRAMALNGPQIGPQICKRRGTPVFAALTDRTGKQVCPVRRRQEKEAGCPNRRVHLCRGSCSFCLHVKHNKNALYRGDRMQCGHTEGMKRSKKVLCRRRETEERAALKRDGHGPAQGSGVHQSQYSI